MRCECGQGYKAMGRDECERCTKLTQAAHIMLLKGEGKSKPVKEAKAT